MSRASSPTTAHVRAQLGELGLEHASFASRWRSHVRRAVEVGGDRRAPGRRAGAAGARTRRGSARAPRPPAARTGGTSRVRRVARATRCEPSSGTWWAITARPGSSRRSSSNAPSPHIVWWYGFSIAQNASLGTLSDDGAARRSASSISSLDERDEASRRCSMTSKQVTAPPALPSRTAARTAATPASVARSAWTRDGLARRQVAAACVERVGVGVDEHRRGPALRAERVRRGDAGAAAEIAPTTGAPRRAARRPRSAGRARRGSTGLVSRVMRSCQSGMARRSVPSAP